MTVAQKALDPVVLAMVLLVHFVVGNEQVVHGMTYSVVVHVEVQLVVHLGAAEVRRLD